MDLEIRCKSDGSIYPIEFLPERKIVYRDGTMDSLGWGLFESLRFLVLLRERPGNPPIVYASDDWQSPDSHNVDLSDPSDVAWLREYRHLRNFWRRPWQAGGIIEIPRGFTKPLSRGPHGPETAPQY